MRLAAKAAAEKKPANVYDGLEELVARRLSEQRARVPGLIDRVISAIVEESCPRNRQAEDWD
ncbi:MAG TPA: hypothetical protein VHC69_09720 [Polyangiaceae bacterium]|nr:hypothetical protein [Polyangiaceae bacterium]